MVAKDAEVALFAQLAVPNVEPLRTPRNDPVKEPVKGRVNELNCSELETVPAAADAAFSAKLAVVAKEAVDGVNVMDVAADAVVAKDAEVTLLAQLAVPNVEPLRTPRNDPVKEPVNGRVSELNCSELETVPAAAAAAFSTKLAVVAKDDETTLLAQLLVPIKVPVNDPVNEPVLI